MGVFREFEVWPRFHLRSCCVEYNNVILYHDISRVYSTLSIYVLLLRIFLNDNNPIIGSLKLLSCASNKCQCHVINYEYHVMNDIQAYICPRKFISIFLQRCGTPLQHIIVLQCCLQTHCVSPSLSTCVCIQEHLFRIVNMYSIAFCKASWNNSAGMMIALNNFTPKIKRQVCTVFSNPPALMQFIWDRGGGGRFKNTYELLILRAPKISMLYINHIFKCMGKIFFVEFQRVPLKFHTQYLIHTLKDEDFIHRWKFKSS